MPRLSTLSNPTRLIDLDKKRVEIALDEQRGRASYSLIKLDVADLAILPNASVVVIAKRGNGEVRTDHGPVMSFRREFVDVTEAGSEGVWRFRVLLVKPGEHMLIAAAENVRPNGMGDSSSLIALEPADLGEAPWEFIVLEQDGRAVIRFNRDVYPTSAVAEADRHFGPLVFPEAIRRLSKWYADNPGASADAQWDGFRSWLAFHGVVDEPSEDMSEDERERWCSEVVRAFCERNAMASRLREAERTEVQD